MNNRTYYGLENIRTSDFGRDTIERKIKKLLDENEEIAGDTTKILMFDCEYFERKFTEFLCKNVDKKLQKEYLDKCKKSSNWKRFRKKTDDRSGINFIVYQAYCYALNLEWINICIPFPNPYGFKNIPEKREIFNDYCGEHVIGSLWADSRSSIHNGDPDIPAYIKAYVPPKKKNEEFYFLRVAFVRQGHGVNATIHAMSKIPLDASQFEFMKFSIRSPYGDNVGVRLRMTDAEFVDWFYAKQGANYENKNLSTKSKDWSTEIKIPLKTNSWNEWSYFGFVPALGKKQPNFSAIYAITLEVGLDFDDYKPNLGGLSQLLENKNEKVIDISPIKFE